MKTKYAALLALGGLFNPASRVLAASSHVSAQMAASKEMTDLCHQFTSVAVNPHFGSDYHVAQNTTPVVDERFMQDFIAGTPGECRAITQFLSEMRQLNAGLANYIDLTFTHLKSFSVATYAAAGFKNQTGHDAVYYAATKTLCLPAHLHKNDIEIMHAVRHEFRHAAMNAAQHVFRGVKTHSVNCFFPDTDEERIRVMNMIAEGDENVIALEKLLKQETENTISEKDRQTLNQLREVCQDEYQRYYPISFSSASTAEEISKYEKLMGKQFLVGETVNFGPHGGMDADVTIRSIKMDDKDPSIKKMVYICNDPLRAAVNYIPLQAAYVKKAYKGDRYLYERDAYLHGSFPQAIIQYLYPNFYRYTKDLIDRARQTPVLHTKQLLDYQDFHEMALANILSILRTPEEFEADLVDSFIPWATYAASRGNREEAKIGLTTLVQKGHHKGEANRLLAYLAYQDKDYALAATHFKRAEKSGAVFSKADRVSYADALYEIKEYKRSLKQFKKSEQKTEEGEAAAPQPTFTPG